MLIEKVRFLNLNALKGEWEIDFTDEAYVSEGIFAITGPTGAGKSTILDAICLGLYGRTPRLDHVTRTDNSIMTHQTGECFSEVTFRTQKGRFRCHWSQHRARRRPEGELQQSRHEIADADTGAIIESHIRRVAQAIEDRTGMDFDRFTRSMLLAQGGFAAFLQAGPDSRAPILEQITGTGIYSLISQKVNERRSMEQSALDALQSALAGIQLLTTDEALQLTTERDRLQNAAMEMESRAAQAGEQLAWIDQMRQLEAEIVHCHAENSSVLERIAVFEPDAVRLVRADSAANLDAAYAAMTTLRQQRVSQMQHLERLRESVPSATTERDAALIRFDAACQRLAQLESERITLLDTLRSVRELDVRIAQKQQNDDALSSDITAYQVKLNELNAELTQIEALLAADRTDLATVDAFLIEQKKDETLPENLKAIERICSEWRVVLSRLKEKQTALKKTQKNLDAAETIARTHRSTLETTRAMCESRRMAHQKATSELDVVRGNRSIGAMRTELDAMRSRKHLSERALESVQRITNAQSDRIRMEDASRGFLDRKTSIERDMIAAENAISGTETAIQVLENEASKAARVRGLSDERAHLEDGQPCPLCGATEHPWADGNIPEPTKIEEALKQTRSQLSGQRDHLRNLTIQLTRCTSDIEQNQHRQMELGKLLDSEITRIFELCEGLEVSVSGGIPAIEVIQGISRETNERIAELTNVIATFERLDVVRIAAEREQHEAETRLQKVERDVDRAEQERDALKRDIDRLTAEGIDLSETSRQLSEELESNSANYGVSVDATGIDGLIKGLTQRRDVWLRNVHEKTLITQRIADFQTEMTGRRATCEAMAKTIQDKTVQREQSRHELECLGSDRRARFGDRRPDDAEAAINDQVEAAKRSLENMRANSEMTKARLGDIVTQIGVIETAIQTSEMELGASEADFRDRLVDAGFIDEAEFHAARLSSPERLEIRKRQDDLNHQRTDILARLNDRQNRLSIERARHLTDDSREAVASVLASTTDTLKLTQQQIGGMQQRLDDDLAARTRQAERIQAVAIQRKEFERWDALNVLIGSADGKKFRNFAQGLTFELMITHANLKLQKLTDRYLLIRDRTLPLELNVIDNYQAGAIRTSKNLSGGESFLVSLALALGLSQMASRNVRIDSLFLDEGFGTLDEETLESALNTLAGLRGDGKIIGVISHIPALKERIGVQIQAVPMPGGYSRLIGPGCHAR